MGRDNNNPVWGVYNKLKTARLNVKYYCRRLEQIERQNFFIELVLLATAPTSAIAGLWFWEAEYGRLAWKVLGVVAAIAAVLKPLLALTKKIKDFESVVSGYRTLEFDLMEIKELIHQRGKYDSSMQADFKKAQQREKALVGKTPETRERPKVKAVCEAEVRRELPDECFFVPEISNV
jgi:hypothetical protein